MKTIPQAIGIALLAVACLFAAASDQIVRSPWVVYFSEDPMKMPR